MNTHDLEPDDTDDGDDSDELLELAPDQDDEEQAYLHPKRELSAKPDHPETNQDTAADSHHEPPKFERPTPGEPISETLRWALDAMHEPAMAAADWLARDIDPEQPSAEALLSNPAITLAQVRQAKAVFKTMRIVGEKSADRRLGARMYAAAIAAGLVRHGKKITTQSDAALKRGFQGLLDDRRMPLSLRDLAGMALCALDDQRRPKFGEAGPQSKSA